MENILNELIAFIREESGEYKLEIDENTLIEDHLGITGADGYDLIDKYSKKFKVNISDFNYSKYFYPEPSIFIKMHKSVEPLTVGDLEKAIRVGRLS